MAEQSAPGEAAANGITIIRVFDAPREQVWQEWTEPERFADWYGGSEAEIPISTVAMVKLGKTFGNLMVDVQASAAERRPRRDPGGGRDCHGLKPSCANNLSRSTAPSPRRRRTRPGSFATTSTIC